MSERLATYQDGPEFRIPQAARFDASEALVLEQSNTPETYRRTQSVRDYVKNSLLLRSSSENTMLQQGGKKESTVGRKLVGGGVMLAGVYIATKGLLAWEWGAVAAGAVTGIVGYWIWPKNNNPR